MTIFLMKINFNACILENSSHIFFPVTGKLSPGKFPPIKLRPGEFPPGKFPSRYFPPGIFPPMFLNIPTRVLSFFHCHRCHWYYLKDCFVILCFKRGEVFAFVKTCQNKVKKGNQWNGWGYLRREFSGWGIFQGGIWSVGISGEEIPQRGWQFS